MSRIRIALTYPGLSSRSCFNEKREEKLLSNTTLFHGTHSSERHVISALVTRQITL